jgi:hypothetical protein
LDKKQCPRRKNYYYQILSRSIEHESEPPSDFNWKAVVFSGKSKTTAQEEINKSEAEADNGDKSDAESDKSMKSDESMTSDKSMKSDKYMTMTSDADSINGELI